MNSRYFYVAYRPNGYDICRGCEMGRSDSDFQVEYSNNPNDIVTIFLGVLKTEWQYRGNREYCSWEQRLIYEHNEYPFNVLSYIHYSGSSEEKYIENWPQKVKEIYKAGKAQFVEWRDKQEAYIKEQAALKEKTRRDAEIEQRRQQYLKLKEEFDNGLN